MSLPVNNQRLMHAHKCVRALSELTDEAYADQYGDWDSNWLTAELLHLKPALDRLAGQIEKCLLLRLSADG
jgi:hypothetical protein